MEGQGDSCRVEPLEERGSNSAVGFDMCPTLIITRQMQLLPKPDTLKRAG